MGVYYSKARKRWACELRLTLPDGTKRRQQTFHKTKSEAKDMEREVAGLVGELKARERLGLPVAEAVARVTSVPTFAEYSERWIVSRQAANLRPATIGGYRQALRLYLVRRFGTERLDQIRRPDVQHFVDWLAVDGGHSPGGVAAIFKVLSACLGRAVRDEHVPVNPCANVELPGLREDERAAKRRALTPDEVRQLLEATTFVRWRTAYRVALGSGVRESELGRLRWADVELDADPPLARVRRAKSGKQRVVPLLPDAVEALREWPRSVSGRLFPFLFLGEDGNLTKSSRSVVKNAIGRAAGRAGLGKVRFHDLRHTWATNLGLEGVPAEVLRVLGGWSSLALVTHYARASNDQALATFKLR